MNRLLTILVTLLLIQINGYSQVPSDSSTKIMSIEEAKKLNGWSEPTINGKPYSQYKAEQEALKKKRMEEEQKAKANVSGPSVITKGADDQSAPGNNSLNNSSNLPSVTGSNNIQQTFSNSNYSNDSYNKEPYNKAFISVYGDYAAAKNTGFLVNAIGLYAAYENSGFEVNAIGTYAGFCNTHNYVNIIGVYKDDAPQDEATILTGDLFLRDPYDSGGNTSGNSIYFNSSLTARIWYDKSAGEIKATDNSGNSSTISPHNFSLIKPSEEMAWSFYSVNENKGKQVNVDMMKVVRLLEQLTGEKLVYIADLEGNELDEQLSKVTSLTERISKLEGENEELKALLKQLLEEMKEQKK
jgi:hypothetical protein